MQIFTLSSKKEISLLGLHLSKQENIDIVQKSNVDDLISLLDLIGGVDLVICEKNDVSKLQAVHPKIKYFSYIENTTFKDNLKHVFQTLGINNNPIAEDPSDQEQYKAVSVDYFSSIKSLSIAGDLYIKIKRGTSEQFVKRLNANEVFTEAEIEKYIQLGLREFYVEKSKYQMVVNSMINLLTAELSNAGNSFSTQKNVEHSTYHISAERLKTIGIDEFTIQLVEESVNSIKKAVNEKHALGKFLKFLFENKSSYAYANCYLTSLIMTSLLKTFDWESDVIKDQVVCASFFHNVSIEDELSLKVFSIEQLESLPLSKEKKDEIKMHALTSSGLVAEFPKISPIVITIIKEHHGSPTGINFPETLNSTIHPMSKCFMVCEYFADQIIARGPVMKKEDVVAVVSNLKQKFGSGSYAAYSNAIEKMTSA